MIVYLSNVSFTPNKQLGRNIYDFSATATEVCEYSYENLKHYRLSFPDNFSGYIYVLKADKNIEKDTICLVPYISENNVLNGLPKVSIIKSSDLNI